MAVVPGTPSHTAILHIFPSELRPSPEERQVTITPALSVRTVWDQQRLPSGGGFLQFPTQHIASALVDIGT